MLGEPAEPHDLSARARSHADWWSGYEPGVLRRLGPTLAALVGLRGVIAGPVLQRAWLSTLVGWSAVRAGAVARCPDDPPLDRFVRLCARDR
jgi:hypothetical protein